MTKSTTLNSHLLPHLKWFEKSFHRISRAHEMPEKMQFRGEILYQFNNQSDTDAIILKLARYLSGLSAGKLLLVNGFLQELCTLQRTLDETLEDIFFLSLPHFGFEKTPDHVRSLKSFWEDEPEFDTFAANQKKRHQVPRKAIRAYLAKVNHHGGVDHSAITTAAFLSRLYSGYVHAAAPQLLELFDPLMATFRLNGYRNSQLLSDHASDFENQFFRGVLIIYIVARIKNLDELAKKAFEIHNRLESDFHG